MAQSEETVPIEGEIVRGERIQVELFVGERRVASRHSGTQLTVETPDGPLEVDVSRLSLGDLKGTSHRGTWARLATRPEAELVASSSPAPHVKARLMVRRLGPGARIAVEGLVTEYAFDERATNRSPSERRARAVRALRFIGAGPSAARTRIRWWLAIPWATAAVIIGAIAIATLLTPRVPVFVVSAAAVLSILVSMRFVDRGLRAAPAMDDGMAQPLIRTFARCARSLPRFSPKDRDANRKVATFLGPVVILAWLFVVFTDVVWPFGLLSGEIRGASLSAQGSAAIIGAQAGSLLLVAIGYLVADTGELPRVRSLLSALGREDGWRAQRGRVAPGASEELLFRSIHIQGDRTISSNTSFFARYAEGGEPTVEVDVANGTISVVAETLAWASDDWTATPTTSRVRVRANASAIVAGFWEEGRFVARGPASTMLFSTTRGDPVVVLEQRLGRRRRDTTTAAVAGLIVAAAAAALILL